MCWMLLFAAFDRKILEPLSTYRCFTSPVLFLLSIFVKGTSAHLFNLIFFLNCLIETIKVFSINGVHTLLFHRPQHQLAEVLTAMNKK